MVKSPPTLALMRLAATTAPLMVVLAPLDKLAVLPAVMVLLV